MCVKPRCLSRIRECTHKAVGHVPFGGKAESRLHFRMSACMRRSGNPDLLLWGVLDKYCANRVAAAISMDMAADWCNHCHAADPHRGNPVYRRILWAVLAINAGMFLVEIGAGLAAGSASLQADALDFLGDAGNYAISLFVVGMALRYRAMAALAKGGTMGVFGLWVIGTIGWHALHGTLPNAFTMGTVGFAALAANAASFGLLWAYRGGDANMRSAWICTRNDVLGNLAVLLAAAGVFGTGTGWPDIIVAAIMAGLALQGAGIVVRQSLAELREPAPVAVHR
jgi:Co/Zn/Cd efflux system component